MKTCSVEGCDSPQFRRTWCGKHNSRYARTGDPTSARSYERQPDICQHPQCKRFARSGNLCAVHYERMRRGVPITAPIGKPKRSPIRRLTAQIIREELDAGLTLRDLARAYGVKIESIERTLQRHRSAA